MATATKISNNAAKAACDAIVDLLDGGSLKIYTGTQPTDPDTAVGAQTLLATLTLGTPAFGDAADANPGARATAEAITSDQSADASGDAAWFRALTSGGAAVIDGSIGTASADMIMTNVSVIAGAGFEVTSWTFTVPES